MALPGFRDDGWLPEGHHPTTWEEIRNLFGGESGTRRAQVLAKLLDWRDQVRRKGITRRLILNGSFISAKPEPGDFDTILIADEGVETILAQDEAARQLVDYAFCKARGWGDIFLFSTAAIRKFPHLCRLDLFDHDKVTKTPKGVVEVSL
jgi:hypothetical protein